MFSGATKTNNVVSTVPAAIDPYFYDVTLLLNGDGTNGSQNNTFLDSSTNAFTLTRNGTLTQGTFTPFGSLWSNYFNGSTDYLTLPASSSFTFGTNNFTVEGWFYLTGVASTANGIFQQGVSNFPSSTSNTVSFATSGTTNFQFYAGNVQNSFSPAVAPVLYQWYHFALVRSSGTTTVYLNGVSRASITDSVNYTGTYFGIGNIYGGGYPFNGYISNLRVVNGTAVYTANFTPPTAPLTAITGTALLTCQSSRFVDNSTNNLTITSTGTPSVQRFSPFNPTSAYSTSVISGSMYCIDTTSFVTVSMGAAQAFGTGDFTVECWVYNVASAHNLIFAQTSTSSWDLLTYGSQLYWHENGGNLGGAGYGTVVLNAWSHFAVSRASGTLKMFINGVQVYSAANTYNYSNNTTARYIGAANGGIAGQYISNVRILKGTGLYTSAFTPPTAPLTAITNTQLLASCTNAGIPDYAMQNDVITQGAAQVSTTQAKFGTGSINFNGSGSYLRIPSSYTASFGTGNFTIEMWIYPTSLPANSSQSIFANWPTGAPYTVGQFNLFVGAWSTGVTSISFSYATTTTSANNINSGTGSNAITVNAWNFVSVIRNGTALTIYVNGTSVVSTTLSTSTVIGVNSTATSGSTLPTGSDYFSGYIDDLRVTKGYARPTTTPTAAWPLY